MIYYTQQIAAIHFQVKKQDILDTGTTYKHSPTIRFKVTNYKNSVNNINWNTKCFCAEYEQFRDTHHGHVIMGNLNIFKNHDIKELLKKGLNFRIKQPYNKSKAFPSIQSGLDKFICKNSTSSKIPTKMYSRSRKLILNKVSTNLHSTTAHPAIHPFINKEIWYIWRNFTITLPLFQWTKALKTLV